MGMLQYIADQISSTIRQFQNMDLTTIAQLLTFPCLKHQGEPMNLICLGEDCQKRGLICALCESQSHSEHKASSLKLMLSDVYKDLDTHTQGKRMAKFCASIDNEYIKCLGLLQSNFKNDNILLIRESIDNYFSKVRDLILKPSVLSFQKIMTKANFKQVVPADLIQFFLKYKQHQKEKDCQLSNYQLAIQQLLQELGSKYTELQKALSSNDKLENILPIYVYAESQPKISYVFSDGGKHTSHTISNGNKMIVQKNNYNTNFALIDPPLEGNKKSLKCKSISIKIVRLTSWITIGVCHQKIAKAASFYFNTGSTGHGAYVISNDGYSWHHTISSMNSFYNNWSFSQGDIINVTWNPKTKTLRYIKNDRQNEFYELTFEFIPGDKLCFCVSLSSHDQSVEIV